ncbi:MAG: Cys-Xaa-Xaa-Xaa repeat radical SAM target protein [Paludibacteraceae bacterium]|nr:Cys-Xaa-Xaa-Xaa repeat radical SAM target protein [Paludibacteraceae bacterium]
MDKNKNEELQSRREFFKSAAKTALPVLGAVVLSSLPIIQAKAVATTGCYTSACTLNCGSGCTDYCEGGCNDSCHGSCRGTCNATCRYNVTLG